MTLHFQINEDYLIAHTLISTNEKRDFSSQENKEDIVAFQDYAWGVSEDLYNVIPERTSVETLLYVGGLGEYAKRVSQLDNYFQKLKQSKEFKVILRQTEAYREFCEKEWSSNYEQASKIIQDLTQFDLENKFTILITHPSLRNGRNLKGNKIVWGHAEDWPNYTLVYLWHEILHAYMGRSETEHALIQLVTDYELRRQLGGPEYPPFTVGHDYLQKTEEAIYPHWQKYLASSNKNFASFQEEAKELVNL